MSPRHEFRPGLEFDVAALEQYLGAHLTGFAAPLRVQQFPGGQSNPTYRLDTSSTAYVLRRKPPGQLLPSAHAIEREYRVMHALATHTQFPVGRPLLLCEDPRVIGTPFYVMEFVEGRIFWDPRLPELPREARRPLFVAMAETLADLHSIDYVKIGLADFGKPEGYVARQLARWSKQYTVDADVAGRVDDMERLIDWLARNAPAREPKPALLHGDYRLDNMIFDPQAPQIRAVLDWELSTVGDPLADFAYHLMVYRIASGGVRGLSGVDLMATGLPSEAEYVQIYCRRRGLDELPDLHYYIAYCLFRLAAICHGIAGRVQRGTAVSPEAKRYAAQVGPLAKLGWQTAQGD
ncbi:MAG: phosphotransferase family protein [Sinobacteraceae bacterium]|nr:phosphotransferase family protein [Nevskiaceae bacterium]